MSQHHTLSVHPRSLAAPRETLTRETLKVVGQNCGKLGRFERIGLCSCCYHRVGNRCLGVYVLTVPATAACICLLLDYLLFRSYSIQFISLHYKNWVNNSNYKYWHWRAFALLGQAILGAVPSRA
jgi:hypothetical protein